MSTVRNRTLRPIDSLFTLLAGLSIGWLVGLSVSPVLQVVVGSIVAGICGIAATARASGESSEHESATPYQGVATLSIAGAVLLSIGVAAGSSVGLLARTHDLFGAVEQQEVNRWLKTGLPERAIYQRLFDHAYPPSVQPEAKSAGPTVNEVKSSTAADFHNGVLFSADIESEVNCKTLITLSPDDARRALALSPDARLRHFAASTKDPRAFQVFLRNFLCYTDFH
jgi:hypothetical protein